MRIRVVFLAGAFFAAFDLSAMTLGDPVELRNGEENVLLCFKYGTVTGPKSITVYTDVFGINGPASSHRTVILDRYSKQCLLLDPKRLLGEEHSAILSIEGGSDKGKFNDELAISCNRTKSICNMFLSGKLFSSQSREDYEEIQRLFKQTRENDSGRREH